jgi:hypothetical protein
MPVWKRRRRGRERGRGLTRRHEGAKGGGKGEGEEEEVSHQGSKGEELMRKSLEKGIFFALRLRAFV